MSTYTKAGDMFQKYTTNIYQHHSKRAAVDELFENSTLLSKTLLKVARIQTWLTINWARKKFTYKYQVPNLSSRLIQCALSAQNWVKVRYHHMMEESL